MDIAKDLMAGLRSRIAAADAAGGDGVPGWADLHARFSAAHAAAGMLAAEGLALAPVGGFDQWQRIAPENSLRSVNRTDLADGKAGPCIVGAVDHEFMAVGRGK